MPFRVDETLPSNRVGRMKMCRAAPNGGIEGDSYFFSKKICLQSALPVFSAECEAMAGRAVAVPALLSISVVLPSAAYSFVLQSVTL